MRHFNSEDMGYFKTQKRLHQPPTTSAQLWRAVGQNKRTGRMRRKNRFETTAIVQNLVACGLKNERRKKRTQQVTQKPKRGEKAKTTSNKHYSRRLGVPSSPRPSRDLDAVANTKGTGTVTGRWYGVEGLLLRVETGRALRAGVCGGADSTEALTSRFRALNISVKSRNLNY